MFRFIFSYFIVCLFVVGCASTKEIKVPVEVKVPVPEKCIYVIPKVKDSDNTVQYIVNMSEHIELMENELKEIPCLIIQ